MKLINKMKLKLMLKISVFNAIPRLRNIPMHVLLNKNTNIHKHARI